MITALIIYLVYHTEVEPSRFIFPLAITKFIDYYITVLLLVHATTSDSGNVLFVAC